MTLTGAPSKALLVIAVVAAVAFLKAAKTAIVPFVFAVFLYYLADPVVRWLTARRAPRWAAILVVVLALAGVLGVGIWTVRNGLATIGHNAPKYKQRFEELSRRVQKRTGMEPAQQPETMLQQSGSDLATGAVAAVGGLLSFAFNLVLVFAYLVLLLRAAPYAKKRLALVWPDRADEVQRATEDVEQHVAKYIGLQSIISLGNGLTAWGILAAYEVDGAGLWAALIFLSQYIPTVGPVAASLPPIAVALAQHPSPSTAGWVALWLLLAQMASGYFIEPRVFGAGMRLDPVLVLLGLMLFGWMWGVFGAFLAVPILVAVKVLCDRLPPFTRAGKFMADPAE